MVVGLHGVTVQGAEKSANGVNGCLQGGTGDGKGSLENTKDSIFCDIREQRTAKGGKLNQLVPAHCHKKCFT
jgi:hypothetical protein